MGAQPPRPRLSAEELAYYRAVEDLFARLRGTPFLLTPKDFALLRRWWQEAVPLAAVAAGVAEVFERSRERGADPVSSLAYCRHAVQRHARRLAVAAAGAERVSETVDVAAAVARLVAEVRAAAARRQSEAGVAAALVSLASALETVPASAAPAAVDELLGRLELAIVEALFGALADAEREQNCVRGEQNEQIARLDFRREERDRCE